MTRRALITGISGQDGSYLAEHLDIDDIAVCGVSRAGPYASPFASVLRLDLTKPDDLDDLIKQFQPDECYHLAAYHRSSQARTDLTESVEERLYLYTNLVATQRILSALREYAPKCRVFLAGSCHMFGNTADTRQNELTPMNPTSLYGITKVASMQLGRLYRERYGLFCATGILFNHESPLRGRSFITTQLAQGAAKRASVSVGDLGAKVDWGFAGDYVRAMRLMLDAETADDYVISSGELHTVKDFAELAYARNGLDWQDYVTEESHVYRPVAASEYFGDSSKIKAALGWKPEMQFEDLVAMMVDHHLKIA